MEDQGAAQDGQVIRPARSLPKKYMEPILYLADRMSEVDKQVDVKERSVIEDLALAVNKKGFRTERWFREMTEEKACEMLDIDAAKRGALVVMALVLKSDQKRVETEHAFFRKIRTMLGAEPVSVPIDVESHKNLALKYMGG